MTGRPTVLVLMGGPDAEREVSILSGTAVADALRHSDRFTVVDCVIERPAAIDLAALPGDVVFPVLHGTWGEGGPLQLILEELGRPFVGCDSRSAALAMDKMRTKELVGSHGVLTPKAVEISQNDLCEVELPVVVKPVDDGSSVDIRICRTAQELTAAREQLHPRRRRLMIEQYIHGRELTVGILQGEVLPAIEIQPSVSFYDYEAKYDRNDTRYLINPRLPKSVGEVLVRDSLVAWHELGCRDLARVDFRLDDHDRVWFLELNTMPGFTTHSLLPMAARAHGLEMPELCVQLVEEALVRSGRTSTVRT